MMDRRKFLVTSCTLVGLSACSTSSGGAIVTQQQRDRRAFQTSLIVGAALGVAIADARGGSLLVGAALGSFAGASLVAAAQLSRVFLEATGGELIGAYSLSEMGAFADLETFKRENVPLINAEAQLINAVAKNSLSIPASQIDKQLENIDNLINSRTVPTEIYRRSAPIYGECNNIMPGDAGVGTLSIPQAQSKEVADRAATDLELTVQRHARLAEEARNMRRALGIG